MLDEKKEELNYWPSYSDLFASLFFIFLILAVFYIVTLKKNNAKLKVKTEILQSYEQDRINFIKQIYENDELRDFVDNSADQSVAKSDTLKWSIRIPLMNHSWGDNRVRWDELEASKRHEIDIFAAELKWFLDGDFINPEKGIIEKRYDKYSVLIISRATIHSHSEKTDSLADQRAISIRNHLREKFFSEGRWGFEKQKMVDGFFQEPQIKYRIYATGVGERDLVDTSKPFDEKNRQIDIVLIPNYLTLSRWSKDNE